MTRTTILVSLLCAAIGVHLWAASLDGLARYVNVVPFAAAVGLALWQRPALDRLTRIALALALAFGTWALALAIFADASPHRAGAAFLAVGLLVVAGALPTSAHRTLLLVLLTATGVSSVAAVWQAGDGSGIERLAGLATTPIALSYQLSVAIPLALALFLAAKRWRPALLTLYTLLLVALGLNATRSALLGVLAAILLVGAVWWVTERQAWPLGMATAASVLAVLIVLSTPGSDYDRMLSLSDLSAKARLPMTTTALAYSRDYPFGGRTYAPQAAAALPDNIEAEVERHSPHNQFLVALVNYGYPGLALLVAFYGTVIAAAVRTQGMLSIGLAAAVLAYGVNSLFHNAGPFGGDWFHVLLIGLLCARASKRGFA